MVLELLDIECGVFPVLFVSDQGVEDGEQFVHGGDQGESLVFLS